ncbi:hypothetical protein [Kitasatospora phosalacinea]|uniref:Uncharacterized protein n=1 Tax=Kitasatospora phosalacinea TaxID=2065 RepID=A0ABW6GRF7_9ACTN
MSSTGTTGWGRTAVPTPEGTWAYARLIVTMLGVEVQIRQLRCGTGCCFLRMDLTAVTDYEAEGRVVQMLTPISAVVASTRRATGRLLGAGFHDAGCAADTSVALLYTSSPLVGRQP